DHTNLGWKRDLDHHGRRNTARCISDCIFDFITSLLSSGDTHASCVGISRRLIRVPRAVKTASSGVGRCIRSRLASCCSDAGTHLGWPHAGGDRSERPFRRKCSRHLSSSTHNQWHHSSVRLCGTWRGMAQTEIKSIAATFCESLPSYFCTGLSCFLRHSLHLCGQNPARHSFTVGVTWDRSCLPCWFIRYCGRNVNGTVRKE